MDIETFYVSILVISKAKKLFPQRLEPVAQGRSGIWAPQQSIAKLPTRNLNSVPMGNLFTSKMLVCWVNCDEKGSET
jgi:hypothetical protein